MEPIQIVLLIAGILLTLAGWSFYKFGLKITGLFLGGSIGFLLGRIALGWIQNESWEIPIAILIGAVCAYLGFHLFFKLYYLLVFLAGWLYGVFILRELPLLEKIGGMVGEDIQPYLQSEFAPWVGGLILGVLAILLHKYIIIILTSFGGAGILTYVFNENFVFIPILVGGILTQLGILKILGLKAKSPIRGDKD